MFEKENFIFQNQLVLRTPYYSVDAYAVSNLSLVMEDQAFRNALLLASPALYRALEKKGFRLEAFSEKERLTVFKYYNRMSFRPTPFGAFASVSTVSWSDIVPLKITAPGQAELRLLPSIEAKIWADTIKEEREILLVANPTLYRSGGSWRLIHNANDPSGKIRFSLQAVTDAPLYQGIIQLAGKKPLTTSMLNDYIERSTGCSPEEATKHASFLIDQQVLLSDRMPGLIEAEEPAGLIYLPADRPVPEPPVPFDPERSGGRSPAPYYTGMRRAVESGGVPKQVQIQLRSALSALGQIVPNGTPPGLTAFVTAFKARFDQQKIPLLVALDPDAGTGYADLHTAAAAGDLLDGLRFPEQKKKDKTIGWTAVNTLLLQVWLQNDRRGYHEPVQISEQDLSELPGPPAGLAQPPSLAVLFNCSQQGLVLESAGGTTATALTGRFSVFDPSICALARELARAEAAANPNVLFAELHQLTHHHSDNINRRMRLYDHIIPLNVFASPEDRGLIPPGDLLVSVRNEEVILESVSLGRRIIPRLPTAFNYQHNELALFRFLCDLQYQGLQADLGFDPERIFPGLDFYPRFSYGETIISLAKWHFRRAAYEHLLVQPYPIGRLHLFRQKNGLPRHISLTQGDQQLVFDLSVDSEAQYFLDNIRDADQILIREYLLPDDQTVTANGERHAGQYVAVLQNREPVYMGGLQQRSSGEIVKRHFPPGSSWLYLAIYCTKASADKVLLNFVSPVLSSAAPASAWFFVRYEDPSPHLRIRIRTDRDHIAVILAAFSDQMALHQGEGLVSDLKSETYSRELERYSPELMDSVEEIFCSGSIVSIDLLRVAREQERRVLLSFACVYAMISRFLKPGQDTLSFLARMKDHFLAELRADKAFIRELDMRYRKISRKLSLMLDEHAGESALPSPASQYFLDLFSRLQANTKKRLPAEQEALLSDLIHMQVNRMFASGQRRNEAVIYYALHKYERSRIARAKAGRAATAGD